MPPEDTVVVLSPPPTPNGPLHVGHLAGPYVAADVAVRALRRRGHRTISVCGLDDHQNYVLTRARATGEPVREVRDRYADLIRGVFTRLGVTHDEFTEPGDDPVYRAAVARFLSEMIISGAFPIEEWTAPACPRCPGTLHHAYVSGRCACCGAGSGGGTCEGCAAYTPASALVDPACTRCGSPATATATVRGPVLRLEDHREVLQTFWARAVIPDRVRALVARLLAGPLPTVPISYPTDWGIPSPATTGHRIDVWAEMGLGYLHTVGRRFAPDASDLAAHVDAWRSVDRLWAFLGLDNAFYYVAMFPALYAAAGLPLDSLAGLVVNEFYLLDGAKFSTSRNHAIWAHEFLAREDPEVVRLFLCWDRPSPAGTDFTLDRYHAATSAWRTSWVTPETSRADLARAELALTPEHFDAALAARCLLAVGPDDRDGLIQTVTGAGSVVAGGSVLARAR